MTAFLRNLAAGCGFALVGLCFAVGAGPADGAKSFLLKKYDADQDGTLSADEMEKARADGAVVSRKEMDEARKALLDRYDTNRDGRLDEAELAKQKSDQEARAVRARELKQLRAKQRANHDSRLDKDESGRMKGDGSQAVAEKNSPKASEQTAGPAFHRYDANRDGRLDEAETKKLRARMGETKRRQAPFDTNKDGVLDKDELARMKDRAQAEMQNQANQIKLNQVRQRVLNAHSSSMPK